MKNKRTLTETQNSHRLNIHLKIVKSKVRFNSYIKRLRNWWYLFCKILFKR